METPMSEATEADPPASASPEPAADTARFPISADWAAVLLAAVFALLAAIGLLPDIPWDSVNLPTFTW
jgi:hypothetical protein